MAEVLLFHHALGQTLGFHAFADALRKAGHRVHTPDLHNGRTFDTIPAGVAHAQSIGFGKIIERGVAAAAAMPPAFGRARRAASLPRQPAPLRRFKPAVVRRAGRRAVDAARARLPGRALSASRPSARVSRGKPQSTAPPPR